MKRVIPAAWIATLMVCGPALASDVTDADGLALVNRLSWGASARIPDGLSALQWLDQQLHPSQDDGLPQQVQARIDAMDISHAPLTDIAAQLRELQLQIRAARDRGKDTKAARMPYQQMLVKLALEAQTRSLLRDLSGTLALAAESGRADLVPVLMDKARSVDMRVSETTTQEKGWMLRAAYALTRQKLPLNVTVNGQPANMRDGAVRLSPTLQQLDAGLTIANKGDAQVWRTTSVSGTPGAALPPASDGLTLSKSIWSMSGTPADVSSLHQNDRVIVEVSGQMPNNVYHQMGVIDLLPAGLEIEQPLKGDDAKAYPFLGTLTDASRQDARDDRFVAAFDIGQRYRPLRPKGPEPAPTFHIAYIARAVSVGRFTLPAADAVDMYAPAIHARTAMGQMTIEK